jgi:hypothetical protein
MTLARVEDLMVQAIPWRKIVAMLVSEGYTDSEHTAAGWRREVMRRWAAEDAEMRPARKDVWRARLEGQYHAIMERAGEGGSSDQGFAMLMAEASRVAKVAMALDGLSAPVKIEHGGQVDVAAMSPIEREQEIKALLAKRAAAMGGN